MHPFQARAMDKGDIADFRRWHRTAALNARAAGFDIVYVYAGHGYTVPLNFISRRHNRRSDEYGGSLENRVRLLRELIEDTKDAVGDTCAVAVRFAVDEMIGPRGFTSQDEGREVVEMLAELPDLWDVNVAGWADDMTSSRFYGEGSHESYIEFVKSVTSKPVVGVGRFTSPDTMVSQIKRGVLDMIGAARPSIADPFLPKKIEEGRIDEIRECIGCNMCLASSAFAAPMRCTQNPTAGEEWRKGWHPEIIAPRDSDDRVLVVGAGPAGLEAARALGQRGYDVVLAEATTELGGRVARECRLPGLSEWGRVRDYRATQIETMANVEVYLDSQLTAADVREAECQLVATATGSAWRRDGMGRVHDHPVLGSDGANVVTPDDIMAGKVPDGPVVIFDDDHYYMGSALAEHLCAAGRDVTLVTPASMVSVWTENTLEQDNIQRRLIELGVEIVPLHSLSAIHDGSVDVACVYTGKTTTRDCTSVVMVTSREPRDRLYHDLMDDPDGLEEADIRRVVRVGDCYGPGTIAAAVYEGHRFARELGTPSRDAVPFKREVMELSAAY
jgi:dimethylamine/trimethylamine dehydrogenase